MKVIVGKIGGNVIDHPETLAEVLNDLAQLKDPFVLVHGGGVLATQMAEMLGVPQQMHEGRRITNAETLEVATMVYAGKINARIVAELRGRGVRGLGINGADGGIVTSVKRPAKPIDFGWVGDVVSVDAKAIVDLLKAGMTPVFSAITSSVEGDLFNTNADTQASEIAMALANDYEVELRYAFDKPGVMLDVNDAGSVLPEINPSKYAELKTESVVHSGMIPKLDTGFKAINGGVKSVVLGGVDIFSANPSTYTQLVP